VPQPRFARKPLSLGDTEPFADAQEAWLWYARCQKARDDGARFAADLGAVRRPCDPDDVVRALIDLWRRGEVGRRHVRVLRAYGAADRPPDARCHEEERAARLWEEGLDRLGAALRRKGIVR
jgi:hypothetical protein